MAFTGLFQLLMVEGARAWCLSWDSIVASNEFLLDTIIRSNFSFRILNMKLYLKIPYRWIGYFYAIGLIRKLNMKLYLKIPYRWIGYFYAIGLIRKLNMSFLLHRTLLEFSRRMIVTTWQSFYQFYFNVVYTMKLYSKLRPDIKSEA